MRMKTCVRCEKERSVEHFNGPWQSGEWDTYCKPCRCEYNREFYVRRSKEKKDDSEATKWCRGCHNLRARKFFGPHPGRKDGLQSYCKRCKQDMERVATVKGSRKTRDFPEDKTCSICKESKTWDRFYRQSRAVDGLTSSCKDCRRERNVLQRKIVEFPTVAESYCASCCEVLPSSEFYRDKYKKDGLQTYCKECNLNWKRAKRELKI